jgi:CubicO group peptidase (beta-lactamase class C family)
MSSSPRAPRDVSRRAAIQATAAGAAVASLGLARPASGLARQQATPAAAEGLSLASVQQAVDALDGIVGAAMDTTGMPGLSVAVVYQDEAVATRGYGVASTETDAPVDADTIFQLASLSKPLASTTVAGVVGDGDVSWETKVTDYLPEFALHEPWPTSQVTIADLLSHRSGLADHAGDALEDMGYDRDTVLHRLRYLRPGYSFRNGYAYTNFGYTAGALAAANAAGQAWEDLSATRLYEPAGMTRTSSRFADFIDDDNHASGHVEVDGAWVPKYIRDADAQAPAGGASSTATDMARWIRLQLGNGTLDGTEIVPAEALAETHRVQVIRTIAADPFVDRANFYGLGWNVSYDDDGSVMISHSGAFALGAGTAVYMLPAAGLGIAVLTNGAANGVAESIALGFLDVARFGAVRNDYVAIFGPIFAADMLPDYDTDTDYSTPPAQPTPPQDASAYTGTWYNRFAGPIDIAADGDGLTISQGPTDDPDVYPLTHWDRDTFIYTPIGENENYPATVIFTIGTDGVAIAMTVGNLDVEHQGTFTRDDATAP